MSIGVRQRLVGWLNIAGLAVLFIVPLILGGYAPQRVSVSPKPIDDVLYNPGMGFADFHFGFGTPPSPEQYPRQTVAYFRWSWADLEPEEGRYNFALVDGVIHEAKAKGETLAFRIMTDYERASPRWLLDKGVASVPVWNGRFPDYNNAVFLEHLERLIRALGARYDGSPDIDHVDIGSIGCWGEWNRACCPDDAKRQCEQHYPIEDNQVKITDWYLQAFPNTPLVMLHGGQLAYATARGTGWRGDCFGDYGYFGPTWNHMEHAYPPVLENPVIAEAWKQGPVQFEVCGVMQDWYDKGFDIDKILSKAIEWHLSVLNAKSSPVPEEWRPRMEDFLKRIGYRFVLRRFTHDREVAPGRALQFTSVWENIGVAPIYHPWPLAYRLRSDRGEILAEWVSEADLKAWLPGSLHEVWESRTVPVDAAPGTYELDVAILSQDRQSAYVYLAIDGMREDRWYPISRVTVGR